VEGVSAGLRAEFARGDGRIKKKEEDRKRIIQPSETLFVVNFNEETTKREDLKMLFEPYGELVRIDMKRNYAFVQFSSIEEATRAKEVTDGGKLESNVLTVEYVARQRGNRDERRGGGGRGGGGYRGDRRGGDDRGGFRGDRRGNYDRFDRPPPDRNDRYDDRGSGARSSSYNDDRYDDRRRDDRGGGGYRGRSPSPARGASHRRSRSRSRSPPRYRDDRGGGGGYRGRSPSPPRGGGRGYDDRDRYDSARDGGRGYDDRDRGGDRYDDRGRDDRGHRY
jgi:RNA recognition motif-containing protein